MWLPLLLCFLPLLTPAAGLPAWMDHSQVPPADDILSKDGDDFGDNMSEGDAYWVERLPPVGSRLAQYTPIELTRSLPWQDTAARRRLYQLVQRLQTAARRRLGWLVQPWGAHDAQPLPEDPPLQHAWYPHQELGPYVFKDTAPDEDQLDREPGIQSTSPSPIHPYHVITQMAAHSQDDHDSTIDLPLEEFSPKPLKPPFTLSKNPVYPYYSISQVFAQNPTGVELTNQHGIPVNNAGVADNFIPPPPVHSSNHHAITATMNHDVKPAQQIPNHLQANVSLIHHTSTDAAPVTVSSMETSSQNSTAPHYIVANTSAHPDLNSTSQTHTAQQLTTTHSVINNTEPTAHSSTKVTTVSSVYPLHTVTFPNTIHEPNGTERITEPSANPFSETLATTQSSNSPVSLSHDTKPTIQTSTDKPHAAYLNTSNDSGPVTEISSQYTVSELTAYNLTSADHSISDINVTSTMHNLSSVENIGITMQPSTDENSQNPQHTLITITSSDSGTNVATTEVLVENILGDITENYFPITVTSTHKDEKPGDDTTDKTDRPIHEETTTATPIATHKTVEPLSTSAFAVTAATVGPNKAAELNVSSTQLPDHVQNTPNYFGVESHDTFMTNNDASIHDKDDFSLIHSPEFTHIISDIIYSSELSAFQHAVGSAHGNSADSSTNSSTEYVNKFTVPSANSTSTEFSTLADVQYDVVAHPSDNHVYNVSTDQETSPIEVEFSDEYEDSLSVPIINLPEVSLQVVSGLVPVLTEETTTEAADTDVVATVQTTTPFEISPEQTSKGLSVVNELATPGLSDVVLTSTVVLSVQSAEKVTTESLVDVPESTAFNGSEISNESQSTFMNSATESITSQAPEELDNSQSNWMPTTDPMISGDDDVLIEWNSDTESIRDTTVLYDTTQPQPVITDNVDKIDNYSTVTDSASRLTTVLYQVTDHTDPSFSQNEDNAHGTSVEVLPTEEDGLVTEGATHGAQVQEETTTEPHAVANSVSWQEFSSTSYPETGESTERVHSSDIVTTENAGTPYLPDIQASASEENVDINKQTIVAAQTNKVQNGEYGVTGVAEDVTHADGSTHYYGNPNGVFGGYEIQTTTFVGTYETTDRTYIVGDTIGNSSVTLPSNTQVYQSENNSPLKQPDEGSITDYGDAYEHVDSSHVTTYDDETMEATSGLSANSGQKLETEHPVEFDEHNSHDPHHSSQHETYVPHLGSQEYVYDATSEDEWVYSHDNGFYEHEESNPQHSSYDIEASDPHHGSPEYEAYDSHHGSYEQVYDYHSSHEHEAYDPHHGTEEHEDYEHQNSSLDDTNSDVDEDPKEIISPPFFTTDKTLNYESSSFHPESNKMALEETTIISEIHFPSGYSPWEKDGIVKIELQEPQSQEDSSEAEFTTLTSTDYSHTDVTNILQEEAAFSYVENDGNYQPPAGNLNTGDHSEMTIVPTLQSEPSSEIIVPQYIDVQNGSTGNETTSFIEEFHFPTTTNKQDEIIDGYLKPELSANDPNIAQTTTVDLPEASSQQHMVTVEKLTAADDHTELNEVNYVSPVATSNESGVDNEGTTYTNEQTIVSMLEAETTTLVMTSLSNQSYSLVESGEISGFPTESTSHIQNEAAKGNYVTDQTELITELSFQPEDNIAGSTVENLIDRTISSVMTIISQAQELTTAGSTISEEQGRLVDHHHNHQVIPDASEYVTVISPSWTKPAVHDPNKEHLTGESTYGSNTQAGSHEQHAQVTGQLNVHHDTTLIKNETPLSENHHHEDAHYHKDDDDFGHYHTADDLDHGKYDDDDHDHKHGDDDHHHKHEDGDDGDHHHKHEDGDDGDHHHKHEDGDDGDHHHKHEDGDDDGDHHHKHEDGDDDGDHHHKHEDGDDDGDHHHKHEDGDDDGDHHHKHEDGDDDGDHHHKHEDGDDDGDHHHKHEDGDDDGDHHHKHEDGDDDGDHHHKHEDGDDDGDHHHKHEDGDDDGDHHHKHEDGDDDGDHHHKHEDGDDDGDHHHKHEDGDDDGDHHHKHEDGDDDGDHHHKHEDGDDDGDHHHKHEDGDDDGDHHHKHEDGDDDGDHHHKHEDGDDDGDHHHKHEDGDDDGDHHHKHEDGDDDGDHHHKHEDGDDDGDHHHKHEDGDDDGDHHHKHEDGDDDGDHHHKHEDGDDDGDDHHKHEDGDDDGDDHHKHEDGDDDGDDHHKHEDGDDDGDHHHHHHEGENDDHDHEDVDEPVADNTEQVTEVVTAFTMEPSVATTEPPLDSTTEQALLAVSAAITMEEAPFITLGEAGEAVPTTTTEEVGRSVTTTTTEENEVMVTTSMTEYDEVTNTTMSNWTGMAFTIIATTEEVGEAIIAATSTEEFGDIVATAATTEEAGDIVTTTEVAGEVVTAAATTEVAGEVVTAAATTEVAGEVVTAAATTEVAGEVVTAAATTEVAGEVVTAAATTEVAGEVVTAAATTEVAGEVVTAAATTEVAGEVVTAAATTEVAGEVVTAAATTEVAGEVVTAAATTEVAGEVVTAAATTEVAGEVVTAAATTEVAGEVVTAAATTEVAGEVVTAAATTEVAGEVVTAAATTEVAGEVVTAAATTEVAGEVVTAAATTEVAGEVVTAAATTEVAGEVVTAAATTEVAGEVVTAAATTEVAGEVVTAAATTEVAGEVVTAAATTEVAGEVVTAAATTEVAGEVVTAAATTEVAGEVVTAAATTEVAGEVVTAAATTEVAGEVVTAAATTEVAGEVVTAAATTEVAGEVVTAAATTEVAGEVVTAAATTEVAGEVVTAAATTEVAGEVVTAAATTEVAGEVVTAAATTEVAGEVVTAAATTEVAGEVVTAAATTEVAGEVVTAAATTEVAGEVVTAAATTEVAGEVVTAAATTEVAGEVVTAAATTEVAGEVVTAATVPLAAEAGELVATAAMTQEAEESITTSAMTEETREAFTAVTMATVEEPGETAAAATTTMTEVAAEAIATASMTEEFTEEAAVSDMHTGPGSARGMVELNSLHDVYINKGVTEKVVSEDHTSESINEIDTFVTLQTASDSDWTTTDGVISLDRSIESAITEKPKIPVSESYTDRPPVFPSPDSTLPHVGTTNDRDGGLARNVSIYHTTGHADEKLVHKELVKEAEQRIVQVTPALTLLLHRLLAENEPTVLSASSDRLGKILHFAKSKLEEKARDFKLPVHKDVSGESDTVAGPISVRQFGSETGTEETPADETATEMNGEYIELTAEDVLLLIPIIIEELKNGVMTAEEQELFRGVFGDLWPIIVAEAAARRHRDEMAAARPRENAPAGSAEARRRRSASIRSLLFGESGTAKISSSGAVESHRGAPLLSEEVLFYEGADNGAEAVDTRPRGRPSSQQRRRHHHRQPREDVAAPAA
ncbi:uncharacterized protein LOC126286331 [Schistocerca gregaria]|uniref:uncharacterized protein LOC126286331 n=1 Tax=Schistocerca gregaria TaxID=7010 RepID=UPI00211E3EC4|nr:uncharacterized protein LOC126286331 [Schistocerca gregaria]